MRDTSCDLFRRSVFHCDVLWSAQDIQGVKAGKKDSSYFRFASVAIRLEGYK